MRDERFNEKRGCFVTLKNDDSEKSLRGCIGFPEPTFRLSKALTDSAIAAATEDPRFQPLRSEKELESLLVEVSILTKPEVIQAKSPKDYPSLINVGRDGLIIRWSFGSGLLLPQVATEFGWNAEDFLCNLAAKAGAPPDQWLVPGTMILKFQSLIYQEQSPNGKVAFIV